MPLGRGGGLEGSGLVSMTPIGAGKNRGEREESLESNLWVTVSVCVCVLRKKIIEEGKRWKCDIWVYSKISSLLLSLYVLHFFILAVVLSVICVFYTQIVYYSCNMSVPL